MNPQAHAGLASIIIPCWNQLECTRFCLSALVRHTRPPWELIVIDNGSTDGTGIYPAGVQDVAPVPVTVVTNARNLGFPAAINQGLKAARGRPPGSSEQRRRGDRRVAESAHRPGGDGSGCNHETR